MTMKKSKIRRNDVLKVAAMLLLYLLVMLALVCILDCSIAEEYYVLCRPESEVNIRERPKLKSGIVACYFFGDMVVTDGQEVNGFVHVVDINGEVSEGWMYRGLLVEDPPVASPGMAQVFCDGRVACRKYADGKIQRWLEDGSEVKVYAISEVWCVTEYGYIKTEFLTVNAKVR